MQGIQEGISPRDTPISDYRADTPAPECILRHTGPRQFGEMREISRLAALARNDTRGHFKRNKLPLLEACF